MVSRCLGKTIVFRVSKTYGGREGLCCPDVTPVDITELLLPWRIEWSCEAQLQFWCECDEWLIGRTDACCFSYVLEVQVCIPIKMEASFDNDLSIQSQLEWRRMTHSFGKFPLIGRGERITPKKILYNRIIPWHRNKQVKHNQTTAL